MTHSIKDNFNNNYNLWHLESREGGKKKNQSFCESKGQHAETQLTVETHPHLPFWWGERTGSF